MGNKPPIVNLDAVAMKPYGKGDRLQSMLGRVGRELGAEALGCTLVALAPGKAAWPYHNHYAEEEIFVILDGEGSLRYDGETYPVRAGDVIFTPTGPGTAHQIVNSSDAELRYMAISTNEPAEVCEYPDSGKIGAYGNHKKAFAFLAPADAEIDYWKDED